MCNVPTWNDNGASVEEADDKPPTYTFPDLAWGSHFIPERMKRAAAWEQQLIEERDRKEDSSRKQNAEPAVCSNDWLCDGFASE